MKKSTKTALIATGIAAASATVLVTLHQLTARGFMKFALDRKAPKILEKNQTVFMGSKDILNYIDKLNEGAEALKSKHPETVELLSYDGINLVGHWYPCKDAKRVIIAVHGWRANWARDFGVIADFLHNSGSSVLFIEQRAQGESGGDYMGFGLLERYDCYEWAKWADLKTEGKLPIYLMGVSMGATTVLMTTGFKLPKSVKGVIADCGFTSPHAIWKHVAENNLKIPFGLYSAISNEIFKKKIRIGANEYTCAKALENCNIPILFVHGTDDSFVPITMTFENYKACKSEKRMFIVPEAEHGMSYIVDPKGYEEKLLEFFKDFD